jgi:hypothetical protein
MGVSAEELVCFRVAGTATDWCAGVRALQINPWLLSEGQ